MVLAKLEYIAKLVEETNILPVTSLCKNGCIFCSHRNNPSDIEVYVLPELSFDEIKEISNYLRSDRKIVIGESASRIVEGEPFLRNDMVDILEYLRCKFPDTKIEITTSGYGVTGETASKIKEIGNIEVNISLNSSSMEGRSLLFKGENLEYGIKAVEFFENIGIEFHGSIVAMPDIVGYKDIEDSISYLCRSGARTVRVFVPGFSRMAKYSVDFFNIRRKLFEIADRQYEVYKVPVLVEPPEINSLDAEVCGIIKGSPSDLHGLQKGDIILKVGDNKPLTRVDAFNLLFNSMNPVVTVRRGQKVLDMRIEKDKSLSSGAVFYYDIDPDVIYCIERAVRSRRSKKTLVVTSKLGYPVMKMVLSTIMDMEISLCGVENKWLGGSIMCAGLLTVSDIIEGIKEHGIDGYDLIVLPSIPFDMNGRDLSGHYYFEIEDELGVQVVIAD